MKKNWSTQSDNFSKKKTHYKIISKNFFCIFSKINCVFFLYIFKESKYFFIFLDISTCLHEWSDSPLLKNQIIKYINIICFYISKLKFSTYTNFICKRLRPHPNLPPFGIKKPTKYASGFRAASCTKTFYVFTKYLYEAFEQNKNQRGVHYWIFLKSIGFSCPWKKIYLKTF